MEQKSPDITNVEENILFAFYKTLGDIYLYEKEKDNISFNVYLKLKQIEKIIKQSNEFYHNINVILLGENYENIDPNKIPLDGINNIYKKHNIIENILKPKYINDMNNRKKELSEYLNTNLTSEYYEGAIVRLIEGFYNDYDRVSNIITIFTGTFGNNLTGMDDEERKALENISSNPSVTNFLERLKIYEKKLAVEAAYLQLEIETLSQIISNINSNQKGSKLYIAELTTFLNDFYSLLNKEIEDNEILEITIMKIISISNISISKYTYSETFKKFKNQLNNLITEEIIDKDNIEYIESIINDNGANVKKFKQKQIQERDKRKNRLNERLKKRSNRTPSRGGRKQGTKKRKHKKRKTHNKRKRKTHRK